jgi:rare lipoprotein A
MCFLRKAPQAGLTQSAEPDADAFRLSPESREALTRTAIDAALQEETPRYTETGVASFYDKGFVGKRMANGGTFQPEGHTAAHKTLPLGTWVRVTRQLDIGPVSTEVEITDRGPYKEGRIIDLSPVAARDLHMSKDGTAEVQIQVIDAPAKPKR